MSKSKEYINPHGEILKYLILNDVSKDNRKWDPIEKEYVPRTYKVFVKHKKMSIEECEDEKDEGVLYVKFVDMEDKTDMIFFVKNGKIKLEKI